MAVRKTVKDIFPDKNITPLSLRRIMVTVVTQDNDLHFPGQSKEDFNKVVASAINTSSNVSLLYSIF
jgi:hypothetical protein